MSSNSGLPPLNYGSGNDNKGFPTPTQKKPNLPSRPAKNDAVPAGNALPNRPSIPTPPPLPASTIPKQAPARPSAPVIPPKPTMPSSVSAARSESQNVTESLSPAPEPVYPVDTSVGLPSQDQNNPVEPQLSVDRYDSQDAQEKNLVAPREYSARESAQARMAYDNDQKDRGNSKTKKTNKGNQSLDPRQKMKIGRIAVLIVFVLVSALGLKSIILPDKLPSDQELVATVASGMGITSFPEAKARGIAQRFFTAYTTYNPENPAAREAELKNLNFNARGITLGNVAQNIMQGPYIFGVKYVSPRLAQYTVGAGMSNGKWKYMSINVEYDPESMSFNIPTKPNLVAAPTVIENTIEEIPTTKDEEATKQALNTITAFFKSWTASNKEELSIFLTDASGVTARTGLGGIYSFQELSSFAVLVNESANPEEQSGNYAAVATISVVDPTMSNADSQTIIQSSYNLLLQYSNQKWFILDIKPFEYDVMEDE